MMLENIKKKSRYLHKVHNLIISFMTLLAFLETHSIFGALAASVSTFIILDQVSPFDIYLKNKVKDYMNHDDFSFDFDNAIDKNDKKKATQLIKKFLMGILWKKEKNNFYNFNEKDFMAAVLALDTLTQDPKIKALFQTIYNNDFKNEKLLPFIIVNQEKLCMKILIQNIGLSFTKNELEVLTTSLNFGKISKSILDILFTKEN